MINRLAAVAVVAVLTTIVPGCVLFSLEPPCQSDENCAGSRRCDVDARVCVDEQAAPSDAGSDDGVSDAG